MDHGETQQLLSFSFRITFDEASGLAWLRVRQRVCRGKILSFILVLLVQMLTTVVSYYYVC